MTIQLSELLMSVPLDRAHIALVDLMDDGAAAFAASRRLRIHLVLAGQARLTHAEGTSLLGPGDLVMTARGIAHGIAAPAVDALRCPGTDSGTDSGVGPGGAMLQPDAGPVADAVERATCGGALPRACLLLTATLGLEVSTPRGAGEGMPPVLILHGADIALPGFPAGAEDGAAEGPAGAGREGGAGQAGDWGAALAQACAEPGGRAVAAAVVNLLYIHAVRIVYRRDSHDQTWHEHMRHRHLGVEAALRLLQRRYGEPWTLASMASAVGMSRSAFALAFHSATGRAPGAHLAELRLDAAARLLGEGVLSVAEIAHAVGFRSQAAFSRAFRRRHGASPREHRAAAVRR